MRAESRRDSDAGDSRAKLRGVNLRELLL